MTSTAAQTTIITGLEAQVYGVRKHGDILYRTKDIALAVVGTAADNGYTFTVRRVTTGYMVSDADA